MNQCLLLAALIIGVRGAVALAQPWTPDLGDGNFKNPVLFADYSDPDVIRVGDDFYLTASSFNCVPGLPVLHSRDLVNWTIISYAIQKMPERFDTPQIGNGIWAPSIRFHDGWFWIFVGDPDWGILMTKAKDPAGPWEPIHVVQEGKGLIDTCPLWDDDGKAYLVHAYANSRAGKKDIIVVNEMSPDGTKLIGEEHLVIDGRNNVLPTIEGPKFYKRNGWYYIMAPAGGVTRGYQIAARSKTPTGTFEVKKVLEQGSSQINGPHQGGWVSTQSGQDWFMHFQDRGGYGRIVHLNPVHWVDDWPMMGVDSDQNGIGEPVLTSRKPDVGKSYPIANPQTSDEFDSEKLGMQWQWQANPKPQWMSLTARSGWLRLNASPRPEGSLILAPNGLLQKFPAPKFVATTKLDAAEAIGDARTGLLVTGATSAAILVSRSEHGLRIWRVTSVAINNNGRSATGPVADTIDSTADVPLGAIWLRTSFEPEAKCSFSYSLDGTKFEQLGPSISIKNVGWMGGKVGLICSGESGYADYDWFRIE